jgi:HEPN domain-containing protein
MDPGEVELLRSWLTKAAEDLASATVLAAAGPSCTGPALFHCQQAAEKAVKAYLAYCGTPFGKTHDVSSLLDLASDTTPAFELLRSEAAALTPYAVAYRYPNVTSPPTTEQLTQALSDARRFFRVTLPLLPPEVSCGF